MKGSGIMKAFRRLLITVISSLMIFSGVCGSVSAEEIKGMGRIRMETTGEGLPDYTEGYEMHGFSDEDAEVITSMFSDEAWAKFSDDMDDVLGFEPVSDSVTATLLGNIEGFVKGNGISSYLQNGNLLQGSKIGLTANRTDKVEVLGTDSNSSDWIYVVDKDATCIIVQDEEGNGIPGALVTISYLNDGGERETKSVVTTDGMKKGIAAFSGVPEIYNCVLDIQAEGYRAMSVLDKTLTAGDNFYFQLKEARENDLYIRGADLSGKDLATEETDLILVDMDTEDMTVKIIVSKTGDRSLPDSVELYSETRGKTVLTISQSSGYDYDSDTRVYYATKRWVEQSADLWAEGDVMSVKFGDESYRFEHLTIKNALETPRIGQGTIPFTQEPAKGNITDRMGGAGWLNFTFQALQVPITFGVFPDGTFILMASYDITNLDQNTQYKYSSLFEKSWKPKQFSNAKNILETFQKSFWENAQKVNSGKSRLVSKEHFKIFQNKTYDISMSFSIYVKLCYNEKTDDYYGQGGFVYSLGFAGGITEYFVFMAGPVAIPIYVGFELSVGIKVALAVNLFTETPPTQEKYDKKWKYTSDDGWDLNNRIDALGNLEIFGGVGIKGVLGANATGYFSVDVAAVLGEGPATIFTADPHSFIDLFWGMVINYYLLFFSGQIRLQCLNKAKRVYDSWGEHDDLTAEDLQFEFKQLSLKSCADELVPLNANADTDPAFTIANNNVNLESSSITNVDAYTYPDNQAQFVATRNHTALFRVVADGEKTHLVYQYQDPSTGDILPTVYQVKLPRHMSVSEYVVVPNKSQTDERFQDYAYIGAVLVDNTASNMNERAKSSEVAAIVVNLETSKTIVSEIASDPADSGRYLYSAPRPAGYRDICDVEYAATLIEDVTTDTQLLETIVTGLKDLSQTITYNYISYREINDPSERHYRTIENGKVFSTGCALPLEPTFWVADPIRSTNKTLVVKGYEADGTFKEDLAHMFQIDISDQNVEDFNYDPVLSNWQYINGRNYFISGNTVYWMYKSGHDPIDYSWIVAPVENGEGMVSTDGRYTMITNNNQSAIYIIGVVDSYDIDTENWTETKSSNKLMLHTLITEAGYNWEKAWLHGPLALSFAKGDRITNFTAAYNPDLCESKGLSVVYSSPIDANRTVYSPIATAVAETQEAEPVVETEDNTAGETEALPQIETESIAPVESEELTEEITEEVSEPVMLMAAVSEEDAVILAEGDDDDDHDFDPVYDEADEASNLRLWKQNAERGMRVTDVKIPDYIFRNGSPYLVANVTYKNYGYAIEGPVMFRVTDEQGHILTITDGTRDYTDSDYFYPKGLYTGDQASLALMIRPDASWENSSEHEIIVEVLPEYYYDGDMDEIINSAVMKADNMTLEARNDLIGDKHYVGLRITNNTFVGEDTPLIRAEFRYEDPEAAEVIKTYSLPTREKLLKYDGEDPVDLVYTYELDMDQVWKDGLKDGLLGIYFALVDKDGNIQSNEVVYVLNPEEIIPDMVSGTKLDENGEPLMGAVIGLFDSEGNEVMRAESDEDGEFLFTNLQDGEYVVKEIEAPESYALNEAEYPITAESNGEVFEIEMVNKLIRGNVDVKLTGPDDKPLAGAAFEIFSGDEKVGTLVEKADGTYEITDLPYGEYTIKAAKLPDGYKVTDTYTVKITENGVTVVVSIKALKSDADSPETGDNGNLMLYAAMNLMSMMAIIEIIRRRKALRAH